MTKTIEIKGKKEASIISLLLIFGVAVSNIWKVFDPPKSKWYLQNPVFWSSFSIILSILTTVMLIFYMRILIKDNPVLVIDNIGIKGSAISSASMYVYWNNIEKFEIRKTGLKSFLIIFTDAPKSYLNMETNPKRQNLSKMLYNQFGSSVIIKACDIKYDLLELNKILQIELQKHKLNN